MKQVIILGMGATRTDCSYDSETYIVNNGYRQLAWHNADRDRAPKMIEACELVLSKLLDGSEAEKGVLKTKEDAEKTKDQPIAHAERLFMVHTQVKDAVGDDIFDFEEIKKLIAGGMKCYNIHKVEGVDFLPFPLKEITDKFETDYFSDTICYMIAFALNEWTMTTDTGKLVLINPDEEHLLKLYGVDMHTESEYRMEKGGIEYWLGIARGLGAKYWVHPMSNVCKTASGKNYGLDEHDWHELYERQLAQALEKNPKMLVHDGAVIGEKLA